MITRRSRAAGAARAVAAVVAVSVLVGATMTGDTRRVLGRLQSAAEARVASATRSAIVDITTRLGYPPWAHVRATGVVIDTAGDVLTNNHVVAGAARVRLRTAGGGDYPGTVVATDIADDLALVRMSGASGFTAIRFGDSAALGQTVYAVGNGQGDCGTPRLTQGVIIGVGESTSVSNDVCGSPLALSDLVLAKVKVEPGYSGGALVDAAGRLVGVLVAGHDASTCSCYDSAFAIPIERAARIADQMVAGVVSGSVHIGPTASLGVRTADATDVGLDASASGALITYVAPGSPADRLGLANGDKIVAVDGRRVGSALELAALLQSRRPGQRVQLRWTDDLWHPHTGTAALVSGPPQ